MQRESYGRKYCAPTLSGGFRHGYARLRCGPVRATEIWMTQTILLVDDEVDALSGTEMLLRLEGFEVISATGVEAAVIALEHHPIDLIITDWMMPGLSGRVLCQRVRERASLAHLPIIATTALAEPTPPRCYDRYVRKPLDFEHLHAVIRELLSLKDQLGASSPDE